MKAQQRPMEPCATLADLRPGDIGFGPIRGAAGALVNLGQLVLGEGFRVGTLDIRHVFVVTEAIRPQPGIVEAMPSGARERALSLDQWAREFAYVRLAEDYPGQGEDAAAIARAMINTPYSFASYPALAAWRFGLKAARLERWIDRRRPGTELLLPHAGFYTDPLPQEAICSVFADQTWSLTGKRIMHGVGRQCVTPGALALRLLEMASESEAAVWTFPGRPAWRP